MTLMWWGSNPRSLRLFGFFALSGAGAAGCSCGASVLDSSGVHDDGGKSGSTGSERDAARPKDGSTTDALADAYSPDTGVESHSGSQVAVVGYRSGDAETTAMDGVLRDKKHDVTCSIRLDADGTARCLPASDVVVFTDPDCTEPIAIESQIDSCNQTLRPTYGVDFWGGDRLCQRSRSNAYELGDRVAPPPVVYNHSIFGCVERHPPDGESYRAATKTSLDDWVKFKRETTKVTAKLGVSSWAGTDGALWAQSLVLLPEGTLCDAATQNGTTARCIPNDRLYRIASPSMFGDSACTQGIVGRCEPNPALIEAAGPDPAPCASQRFPNVGELHRVGKAVDHAEIHTNSGGGCGVAADSQLIGAFIYYTAGDTVPFDQYPLVGATFSGTARLQQLFYVAEDGSKLFSIPSLFYDTAATADCRAADVLADGRIVCVPDHALAFASSPGSGIFTDSKCTSSEAYSDGCGSKVAVVVSETRIFPSGSSADCAVSLNQVAPHSGPLYQTFNNACSTWNPPAPVASYDVGARIEPDVLFPPLESIDL